MKAFSDHREETSRIYFINESGFIECHEKILSLTSIVAWHRNSSKFFRGAAQIDGI